MRNERRKTMLFEKDQNKSVVELNDESSSDNSDSFSTDGETPIWLMVKEEEVQSDLSSSSSDSDTKHTSLNLNNITQAVDERFQNL